MVGEDLGDPPDDQRLGEAVHLGHQVNVTFVAHRMLLVETVPQNRPRLPDNRPEQPSVPAQRFPCHQNASPSPIVLIPNRPATGPRI